MLDRAATAHLTRSTRSGTKARLRSGLKWAVVAVLVAAAFAAGTASRQWTSPNPEGEAVKPQAGVFCSGIIDVEPGVLSLSPTHPGRVTEVLVRENDHVAAGAVLLRTDSKAARQHVQEAQAALVAAELQLAQARKLPRQKQIRVGQQGAAIEAIRQRLAGARELLARKRELVEKSALNAREAAVAEHQVKELEALLQAEHGKLAELQLQDPELEVKQAETQLAAATARLKLAEQVVEECNLRVPRAGTVLRLLTAAGETAGLPGRPVVQLCPDGPTVVRAEVEQEFAGSLVVGQEAVVEDDAASGGPWAGRVARIARWYARRRPVAEEPARFQDVQSVECVIVLTGTDLPFRIGQRVKVRIGGGAP